MARNIVLLSDGTGNSAAKLFKTNVWRLGQAVDLKEGDQVLAYDDGVGTERFKPVALLGSAVGWGLSRNVRSLYAFLCRNYQPGDRIYAFGFSRGAFTIRVLIGLIHSQGLVHAASERELSQKVKAAFRAYHNGYKTNFGRLLAWWRKVPERSRLPHQDAPKIAFVGLWDTVDAHGLPVDELKTGIYYWFSSWSFPDRKLSQIVERACHALSLDDERRTFHPLLWDEDSEPARAARHGFDPRRLLQVWFAGVHSNVGGGYPEDGLSYVSLAWMMLEAEACGLRFRKQAVAKAHRKADWNADIYDSRSGLAAYYRYDPRNLRALCNDAYHEVRIERPKIHESVFRRIKDGVVCYAPTGIPAAYDLVDARGQIFPGDQHSVNGKTFESEAQATWRAQEQEFARDKIWWRRCVYLATVAASLYLVIFPMFHPPVANGACTGALCFADPPLGALQGFLPQWLAPWIESFRQSIGFFIGALVVLLLLLWRSSVLSQDVQNLQQARWAHIVSGPQPTPGKGDVPRSFAYWARNCRPLVAVYRWFARTALPAIFALGVAVIGIMLTNKLLAEGASSLGFMCQGSRPEQSREVSGTPQLTSFNTRNLCQPTGLRLVQGETYEVRVRRAESWFDDDLPANADGLTRRYDVRRLAVFVPLRRSWSDEWYRAIARIGSTGRDEYTLGERPVRIVARSSGELFLFVNDAVPIWSLGLFYRNNKGTADLLIARIDR